MTALVLGSRDDGRPYHAALGWDARSGRWIVVSPDLAAPIEAPTLGEALAELRRAAGLTAAAGR